MKILTLEINGRIESGLLVETLPTKGLELKLLANILIGEKKISELMLYPGNQAGKPVKLIMVVKNLPPGEAGNFLPTVKSWVENFLSPAMPQGWQADLTEPVIFKTKPLPEIGAVFLFFLSPVIICHETTIETPNGPVVLQGVN